jgi:hypothetical protein
VEGGGEELWVMVAVGAKYCVREDWVVDERNPLWDGPLYMF